MPMCKILVVLILMAGMNWMGCKRVPETQKNNVSFLFQLVHPSQKGMDAMVQAVRLRLSLMKKRDVNVSTRDASYISVAIQDVTEDEADVIQQSLLHPARLAFGSVESHKEFFEDLKKKLPQDGSIRIGLDSNPESNLSARIEYFYLLTDQREKLESFLSGFLPPDGTKFWIMPGRGAVAAYLLQDPPQLDDSTIRDVEVIEDPHTGRVRLSIQLDEKHRLAFAELTRKHLHRRLAVLVDGEIRSLPTVETVIHKAQLQIEPSPVSPEEDAEREARALAAGIQAWGYAGGLRLIKRVISPVS